MVLARAIAPIALACGLSAQLPPHPTAAYLQCGDLASLLAERHGQACRAADPMKELRLLLDRALRCNGGSVGQKNDSTLLASSQAPGELEAAQRALDAVREGTIEVRVQCTVFT